MNRREIAKSDLGHRPSAVCRAADRWYVVLVVLLATASITSAAPARKSPNVGYVYPAGGRQGTTFQVVVGGQNLKGASAAYVSGLGVKARVVEYTGLLTPRELTILRDKLRELQKKKADAMKKSKSRPGQATEQGSKSPVWTAADEKMLVEIREKIADQTRRRANPAIAETVRLQVTIAPDSEPGERQLRLRTSLGLSNPIVFCVGQLQEFSEKETQANTREPGMRITLPAVVNGRIMPGDVDRFRFQAKKGQQVVIVVKARQLIPYLADAVPGWFQATLALYDADGKELAYVDDYRFCPDPVLYYVVAEDGEYVVEIKDSIYRGREDFVYRIVLGELPFITSIFPLGGPAGAQTTVELKGWNLPSDELTLSTKDKNSGTLAVSVHKGQLVSNHVPFAVDTLPECLEKEPNDGRAAAQQVTLPLIVNGRIDRPGDWDVFRFEGHAGDKIVAEVYARRLSSPLDSVLKLTDAAGRRLADNDDHEDKGAGLITHHADSLLSATLPADGTYYLYIGDAQHKGGEAYGYRLRISPPRPDFELRVVPSGINARAGATVPVTVYVLRKDGFAGEIALSLKDAPRGFVLIGRRVPAGKDQVRLALKVPPVPPKRPLSLCLEGRAVIQGREIVRTAIPADEMMQAFIYRHLVPAKDLKVAVIGRAKRKAPVKSRSPKAAKSAPAKRSKSK